MHPIPRFPRLVIILGLLLFGSLSALAEDDGIYADFSTSMGDFTCKLAYDKAPRAVASFMGLASGTKSWMNMVNGDVKTSPFYNGIIFHRVINGFVIQGGSPNGMGTDGPGYSFQDEFDSTLLHNKAGILAMANSGANTNGSQFFITLAAQPHLNGVHTVFGEVTSGLPVVMAIGAVPVSGSTPITPVVMNAVAIRRIGTAANAFNIAAQNLPVISNAGPTLVRSGSNYALQFARSLYSEYRIFDTPNLATWSAQKVGPYLSAPPVGDFDVTASAAGQTQHFYRVAKVAYPVLSPAFLAGRELRTNIGTSINLVTLKFNNSGGGTCDYTSSNPPTSGAITSYTWTQGILGGTLTFSASNFASPLTFTYTFYSATQGTMKGVINGGTNVTGTFTLLP